jgi:PKD repeat protein
MKNMIRSIKKHWVAVLGVAVLGLLLVAVPVQTGLAAPAAPVLTASVQDQQCQGGDNVNVTLTATLSPPKTGVRFSWDFNNDGIFDTAPNPNPTVTTQYPDEVNVTATVKVTKGTRSATDSVTFATLRCEN